MYMRAEMSGRIQADSHHRSSVDHCIVKVVMWKTIPQPKGVPGDDSAAAGRGSQWTQ
jgi:hypothetical protein